MRASSIFAVLSMTVCLAAEAGNVCSWTGLAGDGKWSSPENWDTAPVSGNGDELVFDTTSGAIVTENCVDDFDIAKITVTNTAGSNGLTINGSRILFKSGPNAGSPGDIIWSSYTVPVVLNASIAIDKTYCIFEHSGSYHGGSVTVNGDVSYNGSGRLRLRSDKNGGSAVMTFNGNVSAPNGLIHVFAVTGNNSKPVVIFNGSVAAKEFGLNNNTGNYGGNVTVENKTTTPSAIQKLLSACGFLHLKSENVFAEDGVLEVHHCDYGASNKWNGTTLYADQRVKRLAISHRNQTTLDKKVKPYVNGSGYPTLTVADDADEDISFYFDDELNLTWSPVNASTLSITNAMAETYSNTISGTITVTAGKVKACAGTTFKHLSKLVVLDAARFEVAENNVNPFGESTAAFLDANARLVLNSDCILDTVVVAGRVVAAGTYSAAQLPSVIAEDSSGTLTVRSAYRDSNRALWVGQDGEYSTSANWLGGELPSASRPGIIGCFPGALTAKISSATTIDGTLTVDGIGDNAPAVLTTSSDVSFAENGLALGANGKLNVTAGIVTTKDLTTVAGSEIVLSGTGKLTSEKINGSMTVLCVQDATIRLTGESRYNSAKNESVKVDETTTYLRDVFGASAGKMLTLVASDTAEHYSRALSFVLGVKPGGATNGGTSRFSFTGQSRGTVGQYAYVGYGVGGNGELCISDEALFSNGGSPHSYGLFLGRSGVSAPAFPAQGVLRISGGRLLVSNDQTSSALTGFGVGWGLDSDTGNTNYNVAAVYLSGGAITNSGTAAWTVIGAGAAKGAVYQTGGIFAAVSNDPGLYTKTNNTVIGFRGGNGRYEISGGRYYGTQNVIVGGMSKDDGPLPDKYTYLTTDRKGTGVLKVTGGTFETKKDILVSHGGDGTVEIGSSGTLKAANLRLESETAKLVFAIGEGNTCGKIVLSGELVAVPGAAIEVDVSNLAGNTKISLVEAGNLSGLDVQHIVLKGNAKQDVAVRKVGNRLYVGRIRGAVIRIR